ncbi:C-terminal processing protease CtpA/Prc [Flavobacterium arsenatis]|uniref:C-terminal processing protease CtpA/Prc n=1 Tax=Flavobacterium arsenatis TaxID=1484332 RepID=A0ABU1TQQ0_9FLAO|nr:S41 family peptidase [Flavobacterium arsenatis]MDR6968300.1 C-terminal processing protease CtpA/Prc [Flavobacterium arsenatis]
MKNSYKALILFIITAFAFQSCEDMDDTLGVASEVEIDDFIWKGLNLYYLWQEDVPDLADDRFANQGELNEFLMATSGPANLFQSLLYKPVSQFPVPEAVDRFSVLVDDYTYLENLFQGISTHNGIEFGLRRKESNPSEIYGWVKYVIPGSNASNKDIQRGDIFYAVNGTSLTDINFQDLLSAQNYTLSLAEYDGGAITPNGQTVSLTKTQLTENPVLLADVIETGGHKVAYLMYNGFTANFDLQLNQAFGTFLSEGATELVLDLRYNGGGSVQTSAYLASMITGQFNGQLFAKQQWNSKVEAAIDPSRFINNFTNAIGNTPINSMNLSRVYILTASGTASASELVINGLKPYINVVQIGDVTTGKNVGSITLYDSPDFSREDRNRRHKYAMQPLVFKTINKDGFGEYQDGLPPTVLLREDTGNLGQLGNPTEPLLSTALGLITGNARMMKSNDEKASKDFKDSKSMRAFATDMYIEMPEGLFDALKGF